MSFAPGIRLELRQQQSLVLTPQLQQAVRLLQMSNLELASAIDREVAKNPFLQRRDDEAPPARSTIDTVPSWANGSATGPMPPEAASGPAPPFRPADCALAIRSPAGKTYDDD